MAAALLAAAIVVPLIGAVTALAVSSPERRRRPGPASDADTAPAPAPSADPVAVEAAAAKARGVVRGAALATAGLWVGVTLLAPVVAGPFTASGPVAPAGVGAALLAAAVRRPLRLPSAVGGAAALSLLTGGLALVAGAGSLVAAAVALAAGAVVVAVTARGDGNGSLVALTSVVGMAVVAGGLIRLAATQPETALLSAPETGGVLLPVELPGRAVAVLLAAGAAAAAAAGALRPRSVTAPLLPIGLAVAIPAVAALGSTGDAVGVLLAAGAAAAAAAWAARPSADLSWLVVALALVALASAATDSAVPVGLPSGGVPAAWLLAASAVVTAVALIPAAALSAVPGTAALAVVLVTHPDPTRLTLAALVVAAAALAATGLARGWGDGGDGLSPATVDDDRGPLLAALPALAVGAWLLVAPDTWAWAGSPPLDGWSESLVMALAGGLVGAVAAGAAGRVAVPSLPRLAGPDPEPELVPARRRWAARPAPAEAGAKSE